MIAVVSTCGSNISSVRNAVSRISNDFMVTEDKDIIEKSDYVILPGVGDARAIMARLKEKNLDATIRNLKQPTLGICLGMQMLFSELEESGTKGLGIIPGKVQRLKSRRVPHTGWNSIAFNLGDSKLLSNVNDDDFFYFSHSFHVPIGRWTVSNTDHFGSFSATVEKNNFFGVQFHPEKSGSSGRKILENFLRLEK